MTGVRTNLLHTSEIRYVMNIGLVVPHAFRSAPTIRCETAIGVAANVLQLVKVGRFVSTLIQDKIRRAASPSCSASTLTTTASTIPSPTIRAATLTTRAWTRSSSHHNDVSCEPISMMFRVRFNAQDLKNPTEQQPFTVNIDKESISINSSQTFWRTERMTWTNIFTLL